MRFMAVLHRERHSIQTGMQVRSAEGHRLARVRLCSDTALLVQRRPFAKTLFRLPMTRVVAVLGGAVVVDGASALEPLGGSSPREILTHTLPLP